MNVAILLYVDRIGLLRTSLCSLCRKEFAHGRTGGVSRRECGKKHVLEMVLHQAKGNKRQLFPNLHFNQLFFAHHVFENSLMQVAMPSGLALLVLSQCIIKEKAFFKIFRIFLKTNFLCIFRPCFLQYFSLEEISLCEKYNFLYRDFLIR